MPSNLPNIQKENWALNEVVMPTDTNNWGSSINKLTTAIPIYASTGDFYTVQSYENNVISLTPLTYIDGSQNQIPLTYIDGMNIVFKSTFNNQSECSININGLGVKQIKNIDNTLLSADKIKQGYYVNLKYDLLQDCFYLNSLSITNEMGGSGLEVGDISMALYVNEAKNLRRYLNGQIVENNKNTKVFIEDYLLGLYATNPEYFADENTWQTEATLNIDGCVYKFVLNYSGDNVVSVRLPKYPDYVEINSINSTAPVQVFGNGKSLGLSNGVDDFVLYTTSTEIGHSRTGIGSPVGTGVPFSTLSDGRKSVGVLTDPVTSGLVGTANLSTSQTKLKMRYFIQIATGSETENNIINEIELNNPYSLFDSKYSDHELNNLSWLKSEGQWNAKAVYPTAYDKLLKVYNGTETVEGLSVKLSTETYTDYDFVLNTTDETFRLPLKTLHSDDTVDSFLLYFYVGETVQNANLIDAGRIGEQLATKTDMLQASGAGMPSGKYINLTLGASGTEYMAPANGWFWFLGSWTNANGYVQLRSVQKLYRVQTPNNTLSGYQGLMLPITKGDSCMVSYNTTPANVYFRFIYAEGEV